MIMILTLFFFFFDLSTCEYSSSIFVVGSSSTFEYIGLTTVSFNFALLGTSEYMALLVGASSKCEYIGLLGGSSNCEYIGLVGASSKCEYTAVFCCPRGKKNYKGSLMS